MKTNRKKKAGRPVLPGHFGTKCVCAEEGKNGKVGHTRGAKVVFCLRSNHGFRIFSCPNHALNYRRSTSWKRVPKE